ncbi:tyrosine-type recombinase/integrase [Streptomyces sioyaensis]|uniref:tyrosine-type recombinase/integrase n=1 Tax=Streptomyces sioyaensis TaxID=67364 RepID=UPI003D76533F
MPSGTRYWTVIDGRLEVFAAADRFLRNARFGRDRAESTTKAYAIAVALYLRWCLATGRDWRVAAADMGLFMTWLKHVPAGSEDQPVVLGPGATPARGERRINKVLAATRGFLAFAVARDEVPQWVLGQIYDLADKRDLPIEAQGEDARLTYRLRAQHRLHEPETAVDRATDAEVVAMFRVCRSARDRLIVLLMGRAGLRRSEVVGLRRSDLHLLEDNASLGCPVDGAHLHVVRRANVNDAWAKSRRSRVVPLDFVTVQATDQYADERSRVQEAAGSDFLLVNLFRQPLGVPMRPDAINELTDALVKRAGLDRHLTPHQSRHGFASNIRDAGGSQDELQDLMGHASPSSSEPYLHPDPGRLREAVERVPTPRQLSEEAGR